MNREFFNQTCPEPYPADVTAFADELEDIMRDGTHDLDAIVAALNARHVVSGGRGNWSAQTLSAYFAELANA